MKKLGLLKTSALSGTATIFKFIAGIISAKIAAIYLGPEGIALMGNFTNFTSIVLVFAGGAFASGITKLIAEYEDNALIQNQIKHISLRYTLIFSLICTAALIIFSSLFGKLLFYSSDYNYAIIILGICILFFALNSDFQAMLNGHKKIVPLTIVNIATSLIGIILAFVITMQFGFSGALLNPIISQTVFVLIFFILIFKMKILDKGFLKKSFREKNKELTVRLLKFALMAIVSAALVPTSTMLLRNFVYTQYSSTEAGYLQSMWSISNMYLTVIMTTFSIYYLPTLSSISETGELKKEIFKGIKFIIPLAFVVCLGVFLFRDIIIKILYTKEFIPMNKYFLFQCIGDFFKISSYVFSFLLLAKGMTKWFILTEIFFVALYVGLGYLFGFLFGPQGITYAYAIQYFLYLIFMLFLFRKIIFNINTKEPEPINPESQGDDSGDETI